MYSTCLTHGPHKPPLELRRIDKSFKLLMKTHEKTIFSRCAEFEPWSAVVCQAGWGHAGLYLIKLMAIYTKSDAGVPRWGVLQSKSPNLLAALHIWVSSNHPQCHLLRRLHTPKRLSKNEDRKSVWKKFFRLPRGMTRIASTNIWECVTKQFFLVISM